MIYFISSTPGLFYTISRENTGAQKQKCSFRKGCLNPLCRAKFLQMNPHGRFSWRKRPLQLISLPSQIHLFVSIYQWFLLLLVDQCSYICLVLLRRSKDDSDYLAFKENHLVFTTNLRSTFLFAELMSLYCCLLNLIQISCTTITNMQTGLRCIHL